MHKKWKERGGYDAAFNAKDLDKLAAFYHPDVTIFEGGGVNRGWADYRDHHLGPELKQFGNLQFQHSNLSCDGWARMRRTSHRTTR